MNNFFGNLGIGLEAKTKACHASTIGRVRKDDASVKQFYSKLLAFFEKIDFKNWNHNNWNEEVNKVYQNEGVNRDYTSAVETIERLKWIIFIGQLPQEPSDYDIIYLFEGCLRGHLEWVCPITIDGELVGEKLKSYHEHIRAMKLKKDKYTEFFAATQDEVVKY